MRFQRSVGGRWQVAGSGWRVVGGVWRALFHHNHLFAVQTTDSCFPPVPFFNKCFLPVLVMKNVGNRVHYPPPLAGTRTTLTSTHANSRQHTHPTMFAPSLPPLPSRHFEREMSKAAGLIGAIAWRGITTRDTLLSRTRKESAHGYTSITSITNIFRTNK